MPDLSTPQRLHPVTLLQRFLISLPGLVILLLPLLGSPDRSAWFTIGTAVLFGLFTIPVIVLQYLRFRFWVTDREIVIESGVLTRQKRSIPLERIQNIAIEQRLLPRLFGTAKVNVETAGSSATEGVIEYVALPTAHRIREVVRTYQRQETPAIAPEAAAPEAAPEAEAGQLLFAMPLARVLLSGTFRFSLLYIAAIFSGLQYLNLEPDEMVDWLTRGRMEAFVAFATASPFLTFVFSVVLAALFAWLTGIAINLNRFYGFRLHLEDGKLHKRHGLLTVTERTVPLRRIQALLLRSNPLMRAFGWYRLELQTMGLDVQEQGHQVAVPFAKREEVLTLAPRLYPFELPEAFAPVSRLTIRRTFIRYSLMLVVLVGVPAYFWRPALWALLLLPSLLGLAYLQYRHHGYAVHDNLLFVRRGVFRQHLWILPLEKFQVFYADASLFQRRLRLKSVQIDTAGASTLTYPEIVDLEADTADQLLGRLYAQFQRLFQRPSSPKALSS